MSKREQEKVAEQATKNVEVTAAEFSENFTTHNYKLCKKTFHL